MRFSFFKHTLCVAAVFSTTFFISCKQNDNQPLHQTTKQNEAPQKAHDNKPSLGPQIQEQTWAYVRVGEYPMTLYLPLNWSNKAIPPGPTTSLPGKAVNTIENLKLNSQLIFETKPPTGADAKARIQVFRDLALPPKISLNQYARHVVQSATTSLQKDFPDAVRQATHMTPIALQDGTTAVEAINTWRLPSVKTTLKQHVLMTLHTGAGPRSGLTAVGTTLAHGDSHYEDIIKKALRYSKKI